MSIAVISLLALVAIFIVGTVWPVSLGAAAFAATFLVGAILADLSAQELMGLFPVNLFVLLGGITYMFAVAQKNGTMALITNAALRLVRGRVAIIPVIFFLIAAFTSGIGAGPAAATAILAPVALGLAISARINPVLMGLMVVHGCHAGSMSSISPIGAIINGAVQTAGLPDSSGAIFANSLVFNIILAAGIYLLFGGISLIRRSDESLNADAVARFTRGEGRSGGQGSKLPLPVGGSKSAGTAEGSAPTATLTETSPTPVQSKIEPRQVLTLLGICLLIILGMGFKLDIGLTAFTIGLALSLMSPKDDVKVVAAMAWSTILMIGGIMTYIGVVQKVGGMVLVSDALSNMGSPIVGILMVAFLAAFTSLFSATGAVSGALVPLIASLVGSNPAIPVPGAVSTLAISSSVVDSSPFSVLGALLIANTPEDRQRGMFRTLLIWGIAMVVVGSVIPWFLFIVLPMWM